MATFGKTTVGSNTWDMYVADGVKCGCKFTLSESASVSKISVYAKSTFLGNRHYGYAAIYSDSAGAPNALLGSTNENDFTSTPAWVDFTFDPPLTLSPGIYWLTFLAADAGPHPYDSPWFMSYYDAGTPNQTAWRYDTYPFDDPFGAPGGYADYEMSIYATYTPLAKPKGTMAFHAKLANII
jgi:hypothetical protein